MIHANHNAALNLHYSEFFTEIDPGCACTHKNEHWKLTICHE